MAKLREPDDFATDWYGWVCNQAAHAAIVGMTGAWLALMLGLPPLMIPAAVGVLYYILLERGFQKQECSPDQIVDTLHVTLGAAILVTAVIDPRWVGAVLVFWLGLLAYGIYRRIDP